MTKPEDKPFQIPKQLVWEAWQRVKDNDGAPGVDQQDLDEFEANLGKHLYKIWNRMSSGSYFPPPIRAVEVPKPHGGGVRMLGVTVADRVAQTVVAMYLGERAEPRFHSDSYGYRPERSGHDALEACRRRCWKDDWVIDLDIQKFLRHRAVGPRPQSGGKHHRRPLGAAVCHEVARRPATAPGRHHRAAREGNSARIGGLADSHEPVHACVSSKEKGSDVKVVFVIRAVPVMEVGPPGSPCRRGVQTAVMSCRSMPRWEAITETAR